MFRRVGPEVNDLAFRMRCHFPKINCFSLQKHQHAYLRSPWTPDWWEDEIAGPDTLPQLPERVPATEGRFRQEEEEEDRAGVQTDRVPF